MMKIIILAVTIVLAAVPLVSFCNDNDKDSEQESYEDSSFNSSNQESQNNTSYFYNDFFRYSLPLSDYHPPEWWPYSKVKHQKAGNFEVLTIPKNNENRGAKTYFIINGKIVDSVGGYSSK